MFFKQQPPTSIVLLVVIQPISFLLYYFSTLNKIYTCDKRTHLCRIFTFLMLKLVIYF